jgi:hypothetical protein
MMLSINARAMPLVMSVALSPSELKERARLWEGEVGDWQIITKVTLLNMPNCILCDMC